MAYESALSALADPTRRRVFERLKSGPRPVGAIARGLPVSRPAVSQHLKVLKEAGLVADRRQGTRRVYCIDPNGLGALRAWLDQFWDQALAAFRAEAENPNVGNGEPKRRDAGADCAARDATQI
jgi:DNA-binding transcriptional ArsR family regulator